jgi:hypothetical protein
MPKKVALSAYQRWIVLAAGLTFIALAAGACAPIRGVLPLQVQVPPNPAAGRAVKFAEVSDRRVFQVNPSDSSVHSLRDDKIADTALTARAIARKYAGRPAGDVILPEGRTVADLVREAVTKAFRESGYQVLASGDVGYDGVIPVAIEVVRFWAWEDPASSKANLKFEGELRITGDVGSFKTGEIVRASAQVSRIVTSTPAWREVFALGLNELVKNTGATLRR